MYIFTGEELALQDIYIKKISDIAGLEISRADELRSIFNKITAKSLVPVQPKVYVIRDDEWYQKSEKSWTIAQSKNLRKNIIILTYTSVESSSKFYKAHETIATKFEPIDKNVLKNRIMAVIGLSEHNSIKLIEMCGFNYGRIQKVVENMAMYGYIINCNADIAFRTFLNESLISEVIGDIIFDFTDAVVQRDISLTYELYDKIIQTDEGVIKLLSVLYNSFRTLYALSSVPITCRNEQSLGIKTPLIGVYSKKLGYYSTEELKRVTKIIRFLERGIKIGEVEEKYALPYLFSQIF